MADGFSSARRGQVDGVAPSAGSNPLLVAVVLICALYFAREVFVPVALAILLSFVLAPLVRVLQRWGLGRVFPVVTVVLFATIAIVSLAAVMAAQLTQLAGNLPQYQSTMREKISTLRQAAVGRGPLERVADMLQDLGNEINGTKTRSAAEPAGQPSGEQKPLPVEVREPEPGALRTIASFVSPLVHPLATMGIVIVFVVFILLQREDLRNRLIRLAGSSDLHRTTAAMNDAAKRLSRLFLGQVGLNASFGVVVATGLWLIGIPSPILWGIMAAISRFIPYIGAVLAAAFPLMLAAAVDPGWTMLAWTVALFVFVEVMAGHVIEPLLYGHSTGLSPVAVIVSATFWTWLWGPIGLILAMPLTVLLVVLGRHVEKLEFLDVILGDRPPLTGPESFYQRMLAGDPDEAVDQAEEFLKRATLTAYYDEIALKGLQLAQIDATRGALEPAKVRRVEETICGLIDELAEHDDIVPELNAKEQRKADQAATIGEQSGTLPDAQPAAAAVPLPVLAADSLLPAWRTPSPILCIGGRSDLDKAASAMLAQLLTKHGVGARIEGSDALSMTRVTGLETSGVALICLSYLDAGSPVHLRYAVRRLRRRCPDAAILVGFWGAENEGEARAAAESAEADFCAVTLAEALELCLAAAIGTTPKPRSIPRLVRTESVAERPAQAASNAA